MTLNKIGLFSALEITIFFNPYRNFPVKETGAVALFPFPRWANGGPRRRPVSAAGARTWVSRPAPPTAGPALFLPPALPLSGARLAQGLPRRSARANSEARDVEWEVTDSSNKTRDLCSRSRRELRSVPQKERDEKCQVQTGHTSSLSLYNLSLQLSGLNSSVL